MRLRAVLAVAGWTLLVLALIDVAVGTLFAPPADPRQRGNSLQDYFNYGISTEGKLARLVKPTDADSAPIIPAGWIDTTCAKPPAPAPAGKTGVTVYGMSFSGHIAEQLPTLDPTLAPVTYGGPGAPLNHSYACFKAVSAAGHDPNPVQIIGVLASSVQRMLTIGGLTTSFEAPTPFVYPRYRLVNGKLETEQPVLRSTADLRDPARWAAYKAQMAKSDAFYDPLLVNGGLLDRSVFLNMLRRAYAQAEDRRITAKLVNDGTGFRPNPDIGPVMQAMLLDFAATARAQGKIPVVILFQDRGTGADSLYRMLGPALEQAKVPTVSTHERFPVTDPRNFIADGHFTPAVDREIAKEVLEKIRAARPAAATPAVAQ